MRSMTGFAQRNITLASGNYRLEVKSLNHRFLEVKTRLPREFSSLDLTVRSWVQAKLSRGAIELKFEKTVNTDSKSDGVEINMTLAKAYFKSLNELSQNMGLKEPVRLEHILGFREIFSDDIAVTPPEEDIRPALEKEIHGLMDSLIHARAEEGTKLLNYFNESLTQIRALFVKIEAQRAKCAQSYPLKIRETVEKIFQAYPLPETTQGILEARVSQELAFVLDRTDIQEEITRFTMHMDHFIKTASQEGQVGRKLEFILQELGREINTLGNKAQDFGISEWVVEVKTKLEQMREQVLNIE